MLLFAEFDEALIRSHVEELQQATSLNGHITFQCIHRSNDPGRAQMVFSLLHESGTRLVLKKDFKPATPWIAREFRLYKQLQPHFAGAEGCAVPEPVYLGADHSFHVTGFAAGRTASEMLRNTQSQAQANQVFRRCGRWLDHLHRFQPAGPQNIWTNWIFEEVQKLLACDDVHAQPEHYEGYLAQLEAQAHQFQSSPCARVLAHGDFHSGNLILGKGTVCGLDLAYSTIKPGLYDVVDFLASDVNTPLPADDIGPGGIQRASVTYFFKTYRHPVSLPLLNFHLRARLLMTLLRIRGEAAAASPLVLARFRGLGGRLAAAFAQPLDA